MDISYILNELGEDRTAYQQAVAPPIVQTSNFCFDSVAAMRHTLHHESSLPFYTRGVNPTVELLCQKVAALEGTEAALAFASGSAAVAAAVMAQLRAGDHVVCVAKPYSWTAKLLSQLLARFGVSSTFVDGRDPAHFEAARQPTTRLFFLESPNSFTFELQDIRAVAALARAHGILTLIDNSCASPLLQQPIALGADLVIHSATKYLGGHSDAVAGIVCGTRAMMEKIFASEFMTLGGVVSPFNAWLVLRGLRTLPLRMERVTRSTEQVVAYLKAHPLVRRVHYPFDEDHPQHALAKTQMTGAGGQFSVELDTDDLPAVESFCNALRRFLLACSWGGHESLIFPACTLYNSANYATTLPFQLIRFYVGLDEPDALIADLEKGFAALRTHAAVAS